MTYHPVQLTNDQIQQFQTDGFLILDRFVPPDLSQQLIDRMTGLFHGQFETGKFATLGNAI
jgi:phytanoyl-CoA hydroxylase